MSIFLVLAFLFFIGSLVGWCLELIFRRFFSSANPVRKWINPGFLTGPYLPLYGFSLCILFLLANLEGYIPIQSIPLRRTLLFCVMALFVTLIEYFAGLIFIRGMKVKLWDYSREWGNFQGIICPKFSFFWAVLSAVYYFLIHPYILDALRWLSENLTFSFCIGFFYGIFVIDFAVSVNLLTKLRAFAKENEMVIRFEELKQHIAQQMEKQREHRRFLFAMHPHRPMTEYLKSYSERLRDEIQKRKNK